MYKYRKPLEVHEIEKLQELSQLDFSTMNETDVREEYITPLLTLLGYKKNSDYEVEREETSDLIDMSINIGSKRLKLDYKFNIRKKYFWLIEAKTGKDKEITRENIAQAYLYSLHPDINCRFFAVCNGWYFNLYDRNLWLFKNANTDIFTPVLQIKHEELNKETFDKLYSFLGSSEIIFKIKEDILLKDIQSTLEAEIYMDRLREFQGKVDKIISNASTKVRENIWKNNDFDKRFEKNRTNYKQLLQQQTFQGIIDTAMNHSMTIWQVETVYEVIKEKILPYKELTIESPQGFPRSDIFFDYLFLCPLRPIQIEYIWNVTCLLRFLCSDTDLKGMICKYNREKIEISQLLDKYLLDVFSFFESRKDIRVIIILYPLFYRMIKYVLYYFNNPDIVSKYSIIRNFKNKYLSEEELSHDYYSQGGEVVYLAQQIMLLVEKDFINKAFGRSDSLAIKQTSYSIGDKINTEVIKRELLIIETFINELSKNLDIDKLREQIPSGEEDEMFSFDRYYQNPWIVVFLYIVRCCGNFPVSQEVQDKIEELTEQNLIPLFDYARFKGLDTNDAHDTDLIKQLNLKIADKSLEIVQTIKESITR